MILGTHNTMTYKTPNKWYFKPIKFVSKCQKVDWAEQYTIYGVEAFDIRVFWDKNGNLEYRHGLISYDASDFELLLTFCNIKHLTVRILFEERNFKHLKKRSKGMNLKEKFIQLCKEIEEKFSNITFYGGRNTDTWELLYDFKHDVITKDFYGSQTSLFKSNNKFLRIIDDWCPWIYAKLNNKKIVKEKIKEYECQNGIILFDFINIQ